MKLERIGNVKRKNNYKGFSSKILKADVAAAIALVRDLQETELAARELDAEVSGVSFIMYTQ